MINPSDEQGKAIDAVVRWLRTPGGAPFFYLAGYAGTGKTTIAQVIAAEVRGGAVHFAAFTGKAASVLRRKGCAGASTIHRMIYKPTGDEDGRPTFVLRGPEDLRGALLIIDECSMVNEKLGKDLLSFGIPILVLGDPAQLPPVSGEGFFTRGTPDVLLTQIHRQAEGSPILRLATMAREGKYIPTGKMFNPSGGGIAMVSKWDDVTERSKLSAHQIIVGTNATRIALNRTIRESLQACGALPPASPKTPWLPAPGDKVICLRNKHSRGLLNGSMWRVDESDLSGNETLVTMKVSSIDDDAAVPLEVMVPFQCFSGDKSYKFPMNLARDYEEFTFGYAITAHKAQGSEWQNVLVRNQGFIFEEDRHKWLYTAITRASENLILAS